MGFHTFDLERADALDDPSRFRHCSAEELLALVSPSTADRVLDIGSGSGFYTDVIAPNVERLYALDLQPEMHGYYRERGIPDSVTPITAIADALPFRADALDAAFSTMTYHEYATDDSLAELARVLRPGGRVVTVDWIRSGPGEAGPPADERFELGDAVGAFEGAGFRIARATRRHETFVCVAVA
ncbi:class I SAM-dependent methyltransferase [Haloferacaceae archaeon DSL9]